MLKQRKPLRQESVKRAAARLAARQKPERTYVPGTIKPLVSGSYSGSVRAEPKPEKPARSKAYLKAAATLPCKNCGVLGWSQAAHPSTGRGGGEKTDDRRCFPLCCSRPGIVGCHVKFDQHALFVKAARRLIEEAWGADTRRQIVAMGLWPKRLPLWEETPC